VNIRKTMPILDYGYYMDMSDFIRISRNIPSIDYRTNKDFQGLQPQYIILYAHEVSQDTTRSKRADVRKALRQIAKIKTDFPPCLEITGCEPEIAIPLLDKTRPVLVGGFFWRVRCKRFC
jgi:hypothetical protein